MTPFVRFNLVGVLGFAVQTGMLVALDRMGLPVIPATLVAVEAALLHNFAWHERWTWAGMKTGTCLGRLMRFHVSNGLISMIGNAALTGAMVQAGTPLVVASLAAVLSCALLNFAAAHVWVFCAKTWPTLHGHLQ